MKKNIDEDNEEITLKLSFDEVNTIIIALSKRPFDEVYSIISKIHRQSGETKKEDSSF